jgi:hypothetical protein
LGRSNGKTAAQLSDRAGEIHGEIMARTQPQDANAPFAALSPHDAWRQPILRLVDTAVGVAVGVATAWLDTHAVRRTKLIGRDSLTNEDATERA